MGATAAADVSEPRVGGLRSQCRTRQEGDALNFASTSQGPHSFPVAFLSRSDVLEDVNDGVNSFKDAKKPQERHPGLVGS
jgi:hypothetical protein